MATGDLTGLLIGHLTSSAERIRGPEKGRAQASVDTKYMKRIPRLSVCLHSANFEALIFLVVDILGLDQEIQVNLGRDGRAAEKIGRGCDKHRE